MEAKLRDKGPQIFGSDAKAVGKKKMEWDLNDWRWDGDMFRAAPLNAAPSDCRSKQLFPSGSGMPTVVDLSNNSSSCSDETNNERGKRELEKRRRVVLVDDEEMNDEVGSPGLKLGGQVYPITAEGDMENWVEKNGKKTKIGDGAVPRRPLCQVEDCRADLSSAKDYHRRHKVCDVHSKANSALVKNVMQRFCQQCSRFHALPEFDEGKRSCRRRLAGHNRRRRKTHPENATNAVSLNEEHSSSYLLISLLRILSNVHSNSSDHTKDNDLLSHLLSNLASRAGTINQSNFHGQSSESQDLQDAGASIRAQGQDSARPTGHNPAVPAFGSTQKREIIDVAHDGNLQTWKSSALVPIEGGIPAKANDLHTSVGRMKLLNIDLNSVYDDSENCMENLEHFDAPVNVVSHQDSHKASPPQTSGNSGSTSTQSPSSSSEESRTDRIVFKLFGQDPSGIPSDLRSQLLAWLANTPTDIESYIRPGCIILTVYLRMEKSSWEKLCCDLKFILSKFLDSSSASFWKTGWIYTRVRHRVAFAYDGQVLLDTPLPSKNDKNCKIVSVKPLAVSVSEKVLFLVKGYNISSSNTRLLCTLEGKYLVHHDSSGLTDRAASSTNYEEEMQCISFSCSIPDVIGRGFVEVEDHSLSSSFFPFIVGEPDVCSEIRTLEGIIEDFEAADGVKGERENSEASTIALDFVHELGWLLHRNQLKLRLGLMDPYQDLFPFRRFRCIMEFSLDHGWCAVVKKLLGILFGGTVDAGEHSSVELAVLEIGLLHRAVRKNCRPMVEALLNYCCENVVDKSESDRKQTFEGPYLFRPDAVGPGGLTPLHIAASKDGSESILDALTDDPQLVGIEAWGNARDSTGLTPYDYACQRGHHSYIRIVQTKINKKSENRHVVVDIPSILLDFNKNLKSADRLKSMKVGSLETEKSVMELVQKQCGLCEQKLAYGNFRRSLVFCRPAMLAMVTVGAVCVCVALLFKSSPEVLNVFRPFRWELMEYGSS
ncbi:squamosa promoter-binding-like protein 1 [Heracleum sosnowskyi]|uniref:Squamosa promoter-binding-like protein 1 n=1 Tax=Heracleum sosnowskyi TaxID=360622 RepID=A0AAD8I8G0_9APIA|nr:squamosa promoter-binding-like protein 1 [Heracleum sosnowskyi]